MIYKGSILMGDTEDIRDKIINNYKDELNSILGDYLLETQIESLSEYLYKIAINSINSNDIDKLRSVVADEDSNRIDNIEREIVKDTFKTVSLAITRDIYRKALDYSIDLVMRDTKLATLNILKKLSNRGTGIVPCDVYNKDSENNENREEIKTESQYIEKPKIERNGFNGFDGGEMVFDNGDNDELIENLKKQAQREYAEAEEAHKNVNYDRNIFNINNIDNKHVENKEDKKIDITTTTNTSNTIDIPNIDIENTEQKAQEETSLFESEQGKENNINTISEEDIKQRESFKSVPKVEIDLDY